VPVHDCGELADGRPFFVMKLIEGQTLAELLRQSPATPERLPHYLQLFGQVCQAVAFAHAHTPPVLHRDLKPSNVMVGSFGEVQVMDWGIAKLLAGPPADRPRVSAAAAVQSPGESEPGVSQETGPYSDRGPETQTGVAKGTPQFMAPERARGERAAVGPAADVFGLGGILCVLLTGQPPHPDGDRARIEAGDLGEVFARLEGCGADAELVALAKRCLAADPARRLPDAAAVAREVAAHQPRVQERLRQAELQRAAAAVEARAERRRRRLQLGLVGAVLVLILGAVGVLWWDQEQRAAARQKVRDADQAARAAMTRTQKALQALRQDNDNPLQHIGKYREALALAREAVVVAGNGSEEVRREAADVLQFAQGEADLAVKTRELLTAWLDVRQPRELEKYKPDDSGQPVAQVLPSPDRQFASALQAWGLDIDRVSAAEAVARFRGLPVGALQEVVAGLDEWAEERRKARGGWRKLADIADRLDPNELRRELRRLRLGGDRRQQPPGQGAGRAWLPGLPFGRDTPGEPRGRLQVRAERIDVRREAPLTVLALARALMAAGNSPAAEALLGEALAARPNEVVLLDALGTLLTLQRPPRYREAATYYQAVRAVRPELGLRLSAVLAEAGRHREAEAVARDLTKRNPDSPLPQFLLALTLGPQQKFKEATAAYREVLRLRPDFPGAHFNLGIALYQQGKPAEAGAAWEAALRLKPLDPEVHYSLGLALSRQGKPAAAGAAYREAVRLKPDFPDAHLNLSNVL
jgi:serine/threonine-protein kinase